MLLNPVVSYHGLNLTANYADNVIAFEGRLAKLDVLCYVGGDAVAQYLGRRNQLWTPSSGPDSAVVFTQDFAVSLPGLDELFDALGGIIAIRFKRRVAATAAIVDVDCYLVEEQGGQGQ